MYTYIKYTQTYIYTHIHISFVCDQNLKILYAQEYIYLNVFKG